MASKGPFFEHSFSAPIGRLGTLYCVNVPLAVSRAIGVRGNVPVCARVNRGKPFYGTLMPRGNGKHRLIVNRGARGEATAGARLSVELCVRERTREVWIPEDLDAALRDEGVLPAWDAMPPGKREHILHWIEEAVHETTREKRVGAAVREALARHERDLDRQSATTRDGSERRPPRKE